MKQPHALRNRIVALALCVFSGAGAICDGGPPRQQPPPKEKQKDYPVGDVPPPAVLPPPGPTRYDVGDYTRWWRINRDGLLLVLKPVGDQALQEYARKKPPVDTLPALLSLVGYEGDFCSIVKEVGLRRLRTYPKVQDELARDLRDEKTPVAQRAWAAYALGELGSPKAVPALKEALKSQDLNLRGFSAMALGVLGDPVGVDAVLPLARDSREDEDLRCLVLLSLAPSTIPAARQALAEVARKDASAPARRAALMALGLHASAPERLLLQEAASDRDARIRGGALIGLGLCGDGKTLEAHLDPAHEHENLVRAYAALALGIAGDAASLGPLQRSLEKDPDFSVRGCAALALGRCRQPAAVDVLAKASRNRNYSFVMDYAAIGLGLTGRKEAVEALAEGLESKQFDHVTASAAGLAVLGSADAAPPLLKALDNRNHAIVREYAAVALARLRLPENRQRLFDCMEDKTVEVRHAAALGLAVYGDPAACPVLEKSLTADKVELVRVCAALSFDLLTNDDAKPLKVGERFRADPRNQACRTVGLIEINRLLNRCMPENYKLPLTP